ncbi:MAG: transposase [Polyangiales bacterium]
MRRWLQAGVRRGWPASRSKWAPGATPLIEETLAPEILEWVRQGPTACGLNRANWTSAELAAHLWRTHGVRGRAHHAGVPSAPRGQALPAHLPLPQGRPGQAQTAREELAALGESASRRGGTAQSRDEARFDGADAGAHARAQAGQRPIVARRTTRTSSRLRLAQRHRRTADHAAVPSTQRQRRREGSHKTRRLQAMFARHLRTPRRPTPAARFPRVVITIDNAPWHRGEPIRAALRDHPNLELHRLPSYSPQLNVIERLWKLLRRRATHNRLFEALPAMCATLRDSLRYYQVMKCRILSMIRSTRRRPKSHAV